VLLLLSLLSLVLYCAGVEYDRIAVVVVGRVAAVPSCVGDTCVVVAIYYIVAVVIMFVVVDDDSCNVVVLLMLSMSLLYNVVDVCCFVGNAVVYIVVVYTICADVVVGVFGFFFFCYLYYCRSWCWC